MHTHSSHATPSRYLACSLVTHADINLERFLLFPFSTACYFYLIVSPTLSASHLDLPFYPSSSFLFSGLLSSFLHHSRSSHYLPTTTTFTRPLPLNLSQAHQPSFEHHTIYIHIQPDHSPPRSVSQLELRQPDLLGPLSSALTSPGCDQIETQKSRAGTYKRAQRQVIVLTTVLFCCPASVFSPVQGQKRISATFGDPFFLLPFHCVRLTISKTKSSTVLASTTLTLSLRVAVKKSSYSITAYQHPLGAYYCLPYTQHTPPPTQGT